MKELKLNRKDGILTAHGLTCGFIQKAEYKNKEKEMYKEHGVYHVRAFERKENGQLNRTYWESSYKYAEALKNYKSIKLTNN